MTRHPTTRPPAPTTIAASVYVAALLLLTLVPSPWSLRFEEATGGVLNPSLWLDPATWSDGTVREFVLNVLLFAPAGVFAARFIRPMLLAIAAPAALSLAIEITQLHVDGRISDPRDLVANTAGAAVAVLLTRALAPTPRPARRTAQA